jgi:hypothetical protein
VARSTLADANESRDWRIWTDFAQVLIRKARNLYANETLELELADTVYALDSTTIDLCLSVFPWAQFRRFQGNSGQRFIVDERDELPGVVDLDFAVIPCAPDPLFGIPTTVTPPGQAPNNVIEFVRALASETTRDLLEEIPGSGSCWRTSLAK